MTDWNDIAKIRKLDQMCETLGFRYQSDGYGNGMLALYATEDLVVFATNCSLYCGDVDDMINWLHGWERAHQYLNVLGAINPKMIERRKMDYRNKLLLEKIRGEDNAKTES